MKVVLINSHVLVGVVAMMICFSSRANVTSLFCASSVSNEFDLNYCQGDNCTALSVSNYNLRDEKNTCLTGGGQFFNITCQNDCSYAIKNLTETFFYGICITGNNCKGNAGVGVVTFDHNDSLFSPDGFYIDTTPAGIASSSCNVSSQGATATGGRIILVSGPPCLFTDNTGPVTSAAFGSQAFMSFAHLLALTFGTVFGVAFL